MVTENSYLRGPAEILREPAGRAEADREQGALGPGTPTAFMSGSMNQRIEARAGADVQGTDPFRRVQLVAGDGQEIDAELVHASGDFAHGLRRVRVERNPVLASNACASLNRLEGPDLVVCVHQADQQRIRGHRAT